MSRVNALILGSIIEKAIRACHSESDSKFDVLQSVRENLQREYHDTCGAVNTLRFIGMHYAICFFERYLQKYYIQVRRPSLNFIWHTVRQSLSIAWSIFTSR